MKMKSICAVKGVSACGMKEGKYGLALIRASGTAAGVFTENLVKAAPIELMRKQIKRGRLDAIIANRKVRRVVMDESCGYRPLPGLA